MRQRRPHSLRLGREVAGVLLAGSLTACGGASQPVTEWPAYGNDPGGSRWSPLDQIDRTNVHRLAFAWSFSTGDASHDPGTERQGACGDCHTGDSKFEATPILVDGRLIVSTPLNRIVALHPATGLELWRQDDVLRALDVETGEELWKGDLPAGGQATPMTYQVGGRQFVVIAAGGHGGMGTTMGD